MNNIYYGRLKARIRDNLESGRYEVERKDVVTNLGFLIDRFIKMPEATFGKLEVPIHLRFLGRSAIRTLTYYVDQICQDQEDGEHSIRQIWLPVQVDSSTWDDPLTRQIAETHSDDRYAGWKEAQDIIHNTDGYYPNDPASERLLDDAVTFYANNLEY